MATSKTATSAKNDEFAKLSWRERISFALGDFAQNLIFGTVGGFLLFYLTTVNGIATGIGATIFLVVRLINVVWDPFVGAFVDKRTFKSGKYRPYMVTFGIPLVILAAMLFFPIDAVRGNVPYAFLSYLATAMVYSFVNIPYGSLNASLTRDLNEVSILTTTRMTFANIGNLLVYTFFPVFVQLASPDRSMQDTGLFGLELNLGDYSSPDAGSAWFKIYAIYMVLGLIGLLATYFGVKERVVSDEKASQTVKYSDLFLELRRNKPLLVLAIFALVLFTLMFFGNTVWPYFMQYNIGHASWMGSVGLIGAIPGIFLAALWPKLHHLLGKKGFFYTFLGLFIVGQLMLWIWSFDRFNDNTALGMIGRFLQQWGLTSATGYMWALVPEVVSYGEFTTKKRVAGIANAIMGLFFKIGLALGGVIPGYILAWTHFDGDSKLNQVASALTGIQWSFIWIPIILAVVAMYVMHKYPLSDAEVEKINRELAN